jgi:hypothetical protein
MRFRKLCLRKNPERPICGANPTVKELIDYHQLCGVLAWADRIDAKFPLRKKIGVTGRTELEAEWQ